MSSYAIAYCNRNGATFSDTEPYIAEAGTTIKDIDNTLTLLAKQGCRQLTPFEVSEELESYTWDYINMHKIVVNPEVQ